MKHLRSALLFVAAIVGTSTSAFAGSGHLTTTVTPLADSVTYTQPGQTPLFGYVVKILNDGGNTINNIHFTACQLDAVTNACVGASPYVINNPAETISFAFSQGVSCSTDPTKNIDSTPFDCSVGQLKNTKSATFLVWFNSPVQTGSSGEQIAFTGKLFYAETTGGTPTSPPQNSIVVWPSPPNVGLDVPSTTRIKSGVPSFGGTFATAPGGDPLITAVTIPNGYTPPTGQTWTTADILEQATTLQDNPNCNNFLVCWKTTLTIPGTFNALQIVVRELWANIQPGTKIESVVLLYDDPTRNVSGYVIQGCPAPHTPRTDGLPCIDSAVTVKKEYFEWTLLNINNGTYRFN